MPIKAQPNALQALIVVGGIGMWLIVLWLISVIFFLLPNGNADQIPFWSIVAAGFAAYGTTAVWYVSGRAERLRPIILLASLAAAVVGIGAFIAYDIQARQTGDFEGYIFLMSLALSGFGLLNLLYAWRRKPQSRRTV